MKTNLINPAQSADCPAAQASFSIPTNFKVDPQAGVLRDLALMTAGREATGHGLYIDDRTLATALDSVKGTGYQLKG